MLSCEHNLLGVQNTTPHTLLALRKFFETTNPRHGGGAVARKGLNRQELQLCSRMMSSSAAPYLSTLAGPIPGTASSCSSVAGRIDATFCSTLLCMTQYGGICWERASDRR
jgi:hypothetical protein